MVRLWLELVLEEFFTIMRKLMEIMGICAISVIIIGIALFLGGKTVKRIECKGAKNMFIDMEIKEMHIKYKLREENFSGEEDVLAVRKMLSACGVTYCDEEKEVGVFRYILYLTDAAGVKHTVYLYNDGEMNFDDERYMLHGVDFSVIDNIVE